MSSIRVVLIVLAGVVALAGGLVGCSPKSADTPPFTLSDDMKIVEVERIDAASAPSGYPGFSGFVYSSGIAGNTGKIRYRDLESGEDSDYVEGTFPSLCQDGLYYYAHGSLMALSGQGDEPRQIGVSGWERVVASPGNRWLVLISSSAGTSEGRLAINNREVGETIPIAWSEENDARRPSWADDERLLCDATAPEDIDADRAAYELFIDEEGTLRSSVLKLSATEPVENGSGYLACLEPAKSGSARVLAVYDLEGRTRLAWRSPESQTTFGDIVWVTEDTMAVEVETKDTGTSIALYRLEGRQ